MDGLNAGQTVPMVLHDPSNADTEPRPVVAPLDAVAVAPRFGVSPRTVRRLAVSGAITHYRIGRRRLIRFRPEDVEEYLARMKVSAKLS